MFLSDIMATKGLSQTGCADWDVIPDERERQPNTTHPFLYPFISNRQIIIIIIIIITLI